MTQINEEPDFEAVELLVLDVDGVMTDGTTYFNADGEFCKRYDKRDGMGIVLLQRAGIPVAVLTTEDAGCVRSRVENLGIKYYYPGARKKGEVLQKLLQETGVAALNVAYLADDVNDVAALKQVGLAMATADARPEVLEAASYRTDANGGCGAVREVCDRILRARGLDPVEVWEGGSG